MSKFIDHMNLIYAHIQEHVSKAVNWMQESQQLFRLYCTQANIQHLLPELLQKYAPVEIMQHLMLSQRLAAFDQRYAERVLELKYSGDFEPWIDAQSGPAIFACYHLGSYRSIIGHLARFGHHFSLVVDEKVYREQGDQIRETVTRINAYFGLKSQFEIINAESFDGAMRMYQQLKNGSSMILYVDGNTGTGGVFRKDEKLLTTTFMGKTLLARQGIAHLGYLSQLPIVPVISWREAQTDAVLHFYPAIAPDHASKRQYSEQVTRQLYEILEQNVSKYPLQWEGWFYVHKYLDMHQFKNTNALPDAARYSTLKIGKNSYRFDFQSYQAVQLNP